MDKANRSFRPILMKPAFRAGKLTPWGGTKLRDLYHKDAPEETPGESMEVSCIPGFESRDEDGNSLPELIRLYGEKMVGSYAGRPFPLLLKFIDAKEALSVQVHPGNEYAWEHERKLGKTEIWLILSAEPDSEIVYGLKPGTTYEQLEQACHEGKAVEGLLRRVRVREGDVMEIPSGCVHAIGKGIMVFELQQSSDITYRFYDWGRLDREGKPRPLHIRSALDVTDIGFYRDVILEKDEPMVRVVNNRYFSLDLMHLSGEQLLPEIRDFGMVTSFTDGLRLWAGEDELILNNGDTAFVPKASPRCTLKGNGRAAFAMPAPAE